MPVNVNKMRAFCEFINKVILLALLFASATPVLGQKPTDWKAPQEANNFENPLAGNNNAIVDGKKLYTKMCVICHGNKGKGDGVAGMSLKPRPTNLATATVQGQSDGAIYWKITEGRPPMATYESVISEEQRWQLVNYIRTFGK